MSVNSKIRWVLRNSIKPIVGWETWNALQFRVIHGYQPNFEKPTTFLEYLQYIKYYGRGSELAPFVDKLTVKEMVKKRIGSRFVIPTIGVAYPGEKFNFSTLPARWIMKSAHAAGWNHIQDGGSIDLSELEKKISKWLRKNYYTISGEVNYRYIAPKVIFESLISEEGEDLKDYKIWCFQGVPRLIGVHGDRKRTAKGQIFTTGWERTGWRYPEIPTWDDIPDKPTNLPELLEIAAELSRDFPFVRVDLYDGMRGIFFGELTFTPGDGNNIRIPFEDDKRYGEMILSRLGEDRNLDVSYTIPWRH